MQFRDIAVVSRLADETAAIPDSDAAGLVLDRIRRHLERQGAKASTVAAAIAAAQKLRTDRGLPPARPPVDAGRGMAEVEHACRCGRRFRWPAMDPRPRCPDCGAKLTEQRRLDL